MSKLSLKILTLLLFIFTHNLVFGQVAGFTVDHVTGCTPLIVHFHNTSTGATNYSWDFGNTAGSLLDEPSTSYITAGTYTVTLTAFNGTASNTRTMVITVYPLPTVAFAAGDTTLCPGIATIFTNTASAAMPGGLTYSWNFGDGSTSTLSSPSHSYPLTANYDITLFATNNGGCTSSLSKDGYIHVFPPVSAGFNTTTPFICAAPASVHFNNTTTGTPPIFYQWSFGDLGTSVSPNPNHTYTLPGSFNVSLRATDANGCIDSFSAPGYINIGNLNAAFTPVPHGCVGADVTFINTSDVHVSSDWSFGDGGTSTDEIPVYNYSAPGVYSVRLIIFNGFCYDTVIHPITVHANPVGNFTINPALPCPLPATLTYTASAPPGTTVTWVLMDTVTATGNVVTRLYPAGKESIDTIVMTMTDAFGCTSSRSKIDTLYGVGVGVSSNNPVGCIPLSMTFSGIPSVSSYNPLTEQFVSLPFPYTITNYTWNFGDGSTPFTGPTAAAPSHTYTAVGVYTVSCTIATSSGCSMTGKMNVKTGIPPSAVFTATPTHLCAGQKAFFTGTVTGTYDAIKWSYGDGTDSPATTNANHKYPSPGLDSAKMFVYYHGCQNLVVPKIPILVDSPGAVFGFNYKCIPNNGIAFLNFSPNATAQKWYFGDGDSSTLVNPVHFYPSLTLFHTKLITFNSTTGCKDTTSNDVDLDPAFLYFYAIDTSICKDQDATFISFVITPTGGSASAHYWSVDGVFADSTSDILVYPAHNPGLHSVNLIARDDRGCLDTFARNNYLLVGNPVDSFLAVPGNGCGPLNVAFTDFSTGVAAAGAPLINYIWSFGDGFTSTAGTPGISHVYSTTGSYTVTETIIDNIGCIATWTSHIPVVVYKPTAGFFADHQHVCKGSNVHFTNTSMTYSSSLWDFGDGSTSIVTSANHVYTASGTYSVMLVVTDSHGCTDTMTLPSYIVVDPSPIAAFTMSDSFAVCPPLNVTFTNTSSSGAVSYNWFFGNGASSIAISPVNPYTLSGYYTVRLVARNSIGCTDTAIHHANVFGYTGAFHYTPTGGCTPLPVHFNVTLGSVSSVLWDFSDGTLSGILLSDTISHIYTVPGTYIPKLILRDTSGCTNFSYGADTIKVDTLTPNFTISPNPVCQNSTVTFHDSSYAAFSSPTGWSWTFASGATSTAASPSFVYTSSGMFPISMQVTSGSGCMHSVTKMVSVNPIPSAITGIRTVCPGYTTNLGTSSTGGTWSSSTPSVGSISTLGVVTGIAVGTTSITYTLPTGCLTTAVVTVYALPAPITGVNAICAGIITTVNSTTTGGAWSSSNTTVATVTSPSGFVTGLSAGTTTITYTLGTGCITTKDMTINVVPAPIMGTTVFCEASVSNLVETTAGGSWTSSNISVANVNAAGSVTGMSSGTATITYGYSTGCRTSIGVTVNPLPAPITGIVEICQGLTTMLADTTTGGAWSSSIPGIASITTWGLVTGLIDGVSTITYTIPTGCIRTVNLTVDPLPANITGTFDVCVAATVILGNTSPGGTWSSSDPTIASADPLSGAVTGVSAGTTVITYTLSTGCITTSVMTVETLPPPIDGSHKVCAGFAVNLTDGMPGGAWSSDPFAASVGTINHITGVVTGITGGIVMVTYTVFTGCAVTAAITVNTLPAPIYGSQHVCVSSSTTLTDPGSVSGTWVSNNSSIAAIDVASGVVTGINTGVAVISYFISTGCFNVLHVTVNPLPAAITGTATVCMAATTTLHSSSPFGAWISAGTAIASVVSNTGVVTGISAGTTAISYALTTGCVVSKIVTVYPTPSPIAGNANICILSPIPFLDAIPGGAWSSSNTSVVTIDGSTGLATPITYGTAIISYTVPPGSCSATRQITVQPLPNVYNVTGGGTYCAGGGGLPVGLDGSQPGVSYLLYYGSSATGYRTGTGLPLNFGMLSPAGVYSILATHATSGCRSNMTGSALVIITPPAAPTVGISTPHGDTACPGTPVTFTPVPDHGGSMPVYLWKVNGVSVSTASIYSFVPANGDVVTVHMISNGDCLLSNYATGTITMSILPNELPAVSVSTEPGDTICQYTVTTFTASPAYGGTTPAYTWKVNGVAMGSGPVYAYIPGQGDNVSCAMASNYLCRMADVVTSTDVTMTIDTLETPHISITTDSGLAIIPNHLLKLNTVVTNAGPAPTYQWRLNGYPIAGATQSTYTSVFHDNDSVVCAVTSSGLCNDITTFDWVFVSLRSLGVQQIPGITSDIRLLPNPNNGSFTLQGTWGGGMDKTLNMEVADMLGQVVYRGRITVRKGTVDEDVFLNTILVNGMYVLNLDDAGERQVFHFVIKK